MDTWRMYFLEHFLLDCPVLRSCRCQLEFRLRQVLPSLGEAGCQLLDHFSGSRSSRLRVHMCC